MTYSHGVFAQTGQTQAKVSVASQTVPVIIGVWPGPAGGSLPTKPVKISSFEEAEALLGYSDDWGANTGCEAIHYFFRNSKGGVGPVVCIPCMTSAGVVGEYNVATGSRTGIEQVDLIYPEYGIIPNLLLAPGHSETKEVYDALCRKARSINSHWTAFVYADLPLTCASISDAKDWKEDNGYTNENSEVFWPKVIDSAQKVFHLSTIAACEACRIDTENKGIPYEGPSNKKIPVIKQYFGLGSLNAGFGQSEANGLNEVGISSVIYFEGWRLWGGHTAAYDYSDASIDPAFIFSASQRMLSHVMNSFQREWASSIDSGFNRQLKDSILVREQEKLDVLVSQGALLGSPKIQFLQTNNSSSEIMQGRFRWDMAVTPTPPFLNGNLVVAYTDEGFNSLTEE